MPMKARYTVIDGEVIAEKRDGVRREYVPDPQGSTIALLDDTQTKTDTFSYWPYGEEASRTGTTPTPLRFVGTLGYYRDSSSETYVRARHLRPEQGRWLQEDKVVIFVQDLNAYLYVYNRPTVYRDPSGYSTFLGGFVAGCIGGGLISGILSGMRGGACVGICNGLFNCVGNGLVGGLIGSFPNPTLVGCLSGLISGGIDAAAGSLCDKWCGKKCSIQPPDLTCTIFNTLLNGAIGCIIGRLTPGKPEEEIRPGEWLVFPGITNGLNALCGDLAPQGQ